MEGGFDRLGPVLGGTVDGLRDLLGVEFEDEDRVPDGGLGWAGAKVSAEAGEAEEFVALPRSGPILDGGLLLECEAADGIVLIGEQERLKAPQGLKFVFPCKRPVTAEGAVNVLEHGGADGVVTWAKGVPTPARADLRQGR